MIRQSCAICGKVKRYQRKVEHRICRACNKRNRPNRKVKTIRKK